MSQPQVFFTVLLVAVLLGLAGYYAWRQRQTLRRLRENDDLPADERRWLHNQARRRLVGSVLMVIFAGLLVGSFLIEGRAQELANRTDAARERNEEIVLDDDDRRFRNIWAIYWIVLLVGVLAMLGLAAYDFWATRNYGLKNYLRIQTDRRAMIAREIAMRRRDRNGHAG